MSRKKRGAEENPVSFFSFQDIIMCATAILVFITLMLLIDLTNRKAKDPNAPAVPTATQPGEKALLELQKKRDELAKKLIEIQSLLASLEGKPELNPKEVDAVQASVDELRRQLEALNVDLNSKTGELARLIAQLRAQQEIEAQLKKRLEELQRLLANAKNRPDVPAPGGAGIDKSPVYVELNADTTIVALIPPDSAAQVVKTFPAKGTDDAIAKWASTRSPAKDYFILLVRPETVESFKLVRRKLREKGFIVGWDIWVAEKSIVPK